MIPNHGDVMQETQTPPTEPVVQVPVMVAAELQDSLLVVMRDLQRLVGLLDHATSNLMARFSEANGLLNDGVSTFKKGFAEHETMLVGTYDTACSPLYPVWTTALPLAKKIIRFIR